jgi:hypothetical protein
MNAAKILGQLRITSDLRGALKKKEGGGRGEQTTKKKKKN